MLGNKSNRRSRALLITGIITFAALFATAFVTTAESAPSCPELRAQMKPLETSSPAYKSLSNLYWDHCLPEADVPIERSAP